MHENEKLKMLKWLKQKPAGHHHRGTSHSEVNQNKVITDDPLATIQVHHLQQKKSKNKSEEIYAVSRVNPLFEEEDVPKNVIDGGNNSGSSGYDSGPDDDLKFSRRAPDTSSTSSTSSFSVVSRAPPKHGAIFRDDDDPVVHHQAAILAPNGKPVLHIVEQNPDFVQSIAVAVGGRHLSPIDEKRVSHDIPTRSTKVSVHPVPTRSSSSSINEDNLRVAKLIHKENRYVHSIIIGSPTNTETKSTSRLVSSSTAVSHHHQQHHQHQQQYPPQVSSVTKKTSVTFSERVELVADNNNAINGKVLLKGQSQPYRKPSAEQDSIVTESLLLMTSSRPVGQQDSGNNANNYNNKNGNNDINNRLNNPSKSNSSGVVPQQRKVSSSSNSSSNSDNNSRDETQRNEDLQKFSSSIRKNHPVKHILSNSGKSLEINPAADQYSSTEFLDHQENYHNLHHVKRNQHQHNHNCQEDDCCEGDGQGHSYDTDETRSSSNEPECEQDDDCARRPRGACPKSPFGGIADHYAAAKEIAKEIESYSNGSAKTNSKKSIVRELLSGRGREALAFHTAVRKAAAEEKSSKLEQMSPRHIVGNDAIEAWESVRVQQVYLKGRTWKEVEPQQQSPYSSSSSSSFRHHQEEGDTGQRILSVTQQGQVHSNSKKDTSSAGSTITYTTILQQSSSNKHLKSSIYDGHSSEGATSNNEGDDDASSDSGNSTDRHSKGSRKDLLPSDRRGIGIPSRAKLPIKPPDPSYSNIEEGAVGGVGTGSSISTVDKVMIVTGDSQNVVVDLSGVPQDLREAIISGTALITLPDGLKASSANKGGYTIVSIPNSSPDGIPLVQSPGDIVTTKKPPDPENEINAMPSSSVNIGKLERDELYSQIFNSYGAKNKTQIWNVMQQHVQQTLIEGVNGKKKRITTVLPFHPNQDVYKSPDFTMEGQRLEHQKKKQDMAKKRRCVCRVFGILFFLATFIGVLVALSMIYTKGQRYFGSA